MARRPTLGIAVAGLGVTAALAGCGASKVGGGPVASAPCHWHHATVRPAAHADLTGLSFPDARHGWAVGGIGTPVIRVTADGGASWTRQTAPGDDGLSAVSFPDDDHGWAVGVDGRVLATVDGGARWRVDATGMSNPGNLYAVDFVDARHGWVAGADGRIEATTDGGRSWRAERSGTRASIQQLQFLGAHVGFAQTPGAILRTTDGGAHWTREPVQDRGDQVAAGESFVSPTVGWVTGSESDAGANHPLVSTTTDGGRTWRTRDLTAFDDVRFLGATFAGPRQGWAATLDGDLYYSSDGGRDWADDFHNASGLAVAALSFSGPIHGAAVGESGLVLACTG